MLNVKELISNSRFKVVSATTTLCMLAYTIPAHADTLDLATPMTTALNSTVTSTIGIFALILPIGLSIFAAKFAYIKAIDFFAKLTNK